ncbi:MAG: hypothetical protein JWR16_485 [Nevskia sp.]|nr:hypothetical protein [Nevskia sp.]
MPTPVILLASLLGLTPLTLAAAQTSDEWCADAVDFAMGTAQNRALGYSLDTINSSVDNDALILHKQVPSLSADDMRNIAATVYQKEWTRYAAANGMIAACLVSQHSDKRAARTP